MSDVTNRELLTVLLEIQSQTGSIETRLEQGANDFAAHVASDALLAHDVRSLARSQRGFISGLTAALVAIGAGIAAGVVYVVKRLIGHGT